MVMVNKLNYCIFIHTFLEGTLLLAEGSKYEGEFKDGMMHDYGNSILKDKFLK